MSVQNEIDRISTAKSNIAAAIVNKGVAVPQNVTIDELATHVNSIQAAPEGIEGKLAEIQLMLTELTATANANRDHLTFADEWTWIDIPSEYGSGSVRYKVSLDKRNIQAEFNLRNLNPTYGASHPWFFAPDGTLVSKSVERKYKAIEGDVEGCRIKVDGHGAIEVELNKNTEVVACWEYDFGLNA